MSSSVLLWSMLALTIFWAVGAFNRLTKLRARCIESFAHLGQHLLKYSRVAQDHALRTSLRDVSVRLEGPTELWAQLQSDLAVLSDLVSCAKSTHLGAHVSAINEAGHAVTATWGRLRSAPIDLAGAALPEVLIREWDENSMNVKVAVDHFNGHVAEYNAAVLQFPAKVIGSFFDLKPVGQFSIFNEA